MTQMELDENQKQYLLALYDGVSGNTARQMSMYDIGAAMGLDRSESLKTAESLMGFDALEVRTLSGGIGLTDAGVEAARSLGAGGEAEDTARLGQGPLIEEAARGGVEAVAAALKAGAGGLGLPFEALTELVADLRTIDVQLFSPRPKTAILRECFNSIRKVLAKANLTEQVTRIDRLLA